MPVAPPFRQHDPLRTFQFRVSVPLDQTTAGVQTGTRVVAGVQRVSGLTQIATASETWSGGNNLHRYANPERITWDPVVIESGLALDDTFAVWAAAVREFLETGKRPSVPIKRTVFIDVWDGVPQDRGATGPTDPPRSVRYVLANAWLSRFQALPRLDALTSEVALQSAEFVHEGWSRLASPDEAATLPKPVTTSGSALQLVLGSDPSTPTF
ncbi:MAG: phage tail protein [Myxococcota bacterium]